jgi:hypothetical protein
LRQVSLWQQIDRSCVFEIFLALCMVSSCRWCGGHFEYYSIDSGFCLNLTESIAGSWSGRTRLLLWSSLLCVVHTTSGSFKRLWSAVRICPAYEPDSGQCGIVQCPVLQLY